jgi:hypothetical protein
MTVETPERAWTDSRIDDLKESVDKGFAEARADNKDLRKEMKDGFAKADTKMDAGFAKADEKLGTNIREVRNEMKEGFDKLTRWLLGAAVSIICTLLVSHFS